MSDENYLSAKHRNFKILYSLLISWNIKIFDWKWAALKLCNTLCSTGARTTGTLYHVFRRAHVVMVWDLHESQIKHWFIVFNVAVCNQCSVWKGLTFEVVGFFHISTVAGIICYVCPNNILCRQWTASIVCIKFC